MMTRRTLLAGTATLLAAAPAQRILDTHTHFYDPSRPQGVPWPPREDKLLYRTVLPDEYRELVEPLGVRSTIVVEASAWLEDNQWVLDLAQRHPMIVGLVGRIEPGAPGFARSLERFRKNPLFLGIRVGTGVLHDRLTRPAFTDDMKRLAQAGLSLDVVGAPTMLPDVLTLTQRVPNLRIILDHLPFDGADASALREVAQRRSVYAKVSNVLRRTNDKVETSTAAYRDRLDELWSLFGEDRVIYGSNWPVSNRVAPYTAVLNIVREYATARSPVAADKYFWLNAKAAYRSPRQQV